MIASAISRFEQVVRRSQDPFGAVPWQRATFDDYRAMVQESPVSTRLHEFRDRAGALYGVCLTDALDDGWSGQRLLDDALTGHQSRRDERVKPLYDFTCELARLEPPPPHMQQLFAALRGNRDATNRFFSAITGSSPLPSFMNPDNLERILARAGTPLTHT